jgi:hypothetical protein
MKMRDAECPGGTVKKEDAVESLERAGHTINDVNARIWTVALNPTQYGWPQSIASIAAIPVLSAASVGQLVSEAVVRQISPSVFERLSNFGQSSTGDSKKDG